MICCSILCNLLIYNILTESTEENVYKTNIYVDGVTEFRKDN